MRMGLHPRPRQQRTTTPRPPMRTSLSARRAPKQQQQQRPRGVPPPPLLSDWAGGESTRWSCGRGRSRCPPGRGSRGSFFTHPPRGRCFPARPCPSSSRAGACSRGEGEEEGGRGRREVGGMRAASARLSRGLPTRQASPRHHHPPQLAQRSRGALHGLQRSPLSPPPPLLAPLPLPLPLHPSAPTPSLLPLLTALRTLPPCGSPRRGRWCSG